MFGIPHALSLSTNILSLTNVTSSSQNNNRCFGKLVHELLKVCLPSLTHHLHLDLSGGALRPGFGVCAWVWWPSGGPGYVCQLCCHLLRMDCWAGPCGTSLYLWGDHGRAWLTEARRTELVGDNAGKAWNAVIKEASSRGWSSLGDIRVREQSQMSYREERQSCSSAMINRRHAQPGCSVHKQELPNHHRGGKQWEESEKKVTNWWKFQSSEELLSAHQPLLLRLVPSRR